ncbi:MAG: hypothetical protein JXI43_14030 [Tissierellales bacterium]|nr:hypothetical protein [Tissierellales bacterium]
MTQKVTTSSLPSGLHFYWYERKPNEEHRWYWGQLCGSMHRLTFIRDELESIKRISDIDLALRRLAYHMENYLIKIYELRERASKLLAAYSGYKENPGKLKGRKTREKIVRSLSAIDDKTSQSYLKLLSIIDDDIDLRNQNTHDTFLSLGFSTGYDIYDPHDALLDLEHRPKTYGDFKKRLRLDIRETVRQYDVKISEIIKFTMELLNQLEFIKQQTKNKV